MPRYAVLLLLVLATVVYAQDGVGPDDEPIPEGGDAVPWEWTPRAGLALALCFLVSALANASGVGGGALFVPLFVVALDLPLRRATALSQAVIAIGSAGSVALSGRHRHPQDASRSAIDTRLALRLAPATLLGSAIGVLFHRLAPGWLLTVLLVAALSALTFRSARSVSVMRRRETAAKRAELAGLLVIDRGEGGGGVDDGPGEPGKGKDDTPTPFVTETSGDGEAPGGASPRSALACIPSASSSSSARSGHAPGSSDSPELGWAGLAGGGKGDEAGGLTPTPSAVPERTPATETAAARGVAPPAIAAPAVPAAGPGAPRARIFSAATPARDLAMLTLLWAAYLATLLFQAPYEPCSREFAAILGVQFLLLAGSTAWGFWDAVGGYGGLGWVSRESRDRDLRASLLERGESSDGGDDGDWDGDGSGDEDSPEGDSPAPPDETIKYLGRWPLPLASTTYTLVTIGGAMAATLGLGGGTVLVPILLELGVHVQVAASTTLLVVLFSSSAVASAFAAQGTIEPRSALVFGVAAVAGGAAGVLALGSLVRRTGRASMLGAALVAVMGLGVLTTAAFSGTDAILELVRGQDLGFRSLCG